MKSPSASRSLLGTLLLASLPLLHSVEPEIVAVLPPDIPAGNIAVSTEGRIFMSVHGFFGSREHRVVEVMPDGSTIPYPSAEWSAAPEGDGPGLTGVLGLRVDQEGILWMLDGQEDGRSGRLVGWNTQSEMLHRIHYLAPPITTPDSFLNDLAVDKVNQAIYVAESSGAILVVDQITGRTRRVLDGHQSTIPEDIDMIIDNSLVTLGGEPARVGINPITVDHEGKWLYYGPMSATSLYRVPTAALRDPSLAPEDLANQVERYGDKPISDGSTIDAAGNVYITSVTDASIGVTAADGSYRTLYQSDSLPWPDGFSTGPGGHIYATINALHRSTSLSDGKLDDRSHFRIVKFPALSPVVVGR